MKHAFGEESHLNKIFILGIVLLNLVAFFTTVDKLREVLISAETS